MGNHAGKDGIGHTVSSLDFFHTPPSSPSEEAQLSALASATSSVFTHQMQTPFSPCPLATTPSTSLRQQPFHRDWALISMESQHSPETSQGLEKVEAELVGEKRRGAAGTLLSPAPMPPSWSLPPVEHRWQENDSGLESPRGTEQVGQETSLVMQSLMEYYRATSGLRPGQDDAVAAVDLLRRLLAERGELAEEVQGLKETLRTERAEWRQFQSDLQVAVAVADRLRAEAEQALAALRGRHVATETQLAQALRRQREQDGELRDLQARDRDGRHQLTTLLDQRRPREGAVLDTQMNARCSARHGAEPEDDASLRNALRGGKADDGKEDGKRGNCALVVAGKIASEGVDTEVDAQDGEGHRKTHRNRADDGTARCLHGSLLGDGDPKSEEAQLTGKGVAEAYILRLAAIKKKKEEEEAGNGTPDQRRVVMLSERSWSLSRLPLPDNTNKSSPSPNSSATLPLCKKEEPAKGRKSTRCLLRQDSWANFSTKEKQDEEQISDSRPKDGFSVLLRRHGGSRRNALLRWCQTRTQGYKNIDITNFSSSWEDGLAFCAIYHSYMPSHIPYGSLTPKDKKGNLDLAFQTGNCIGITTTLTVEEILKVDGPDWQRVLGYVESIFRHFEM